MKTPSKKLLLLLWSEIVQEWKLHRPPPPCSPRTWRGHFLPFQVTQGESKHSKCHTHLLVCTKLRSWRYWFFTQLFYFFWVCLLSSPHVHKTKYYAALWGVERTVLFLLIHIPSSPSSDGTALYDRMSEPNAIVGRDQWNFLWKGKCPYLSLNISWYASPTLSYFCELFWVSILNAKWSYYNEKTQLIQKNKLSWEARRTLLVQKR